MAAQPPRIDFNTRWNRIREGIHEPQKYQYRNYTEDELKALREQAEERLTRLKDYRHFERTPERYFNFDQAQNLAAMTSGKNPAAIRHMPVLTSATSADRWLKSPQNIKKYSGFKVDEEDINNDGLTDIIVYDRYGRPFAVNGYVLTQSNLPLQKAYYTAHPTKEERENERMNDWINSKYWGVTDDYKSGLAELPPTSAETASFFSKMKAAGYKVPKKPNKLKPIYNIIYEKYFEPLFDAAARELINKYYKDSLIRRDIYRILKCSKIISIFYNQVLKIVFYTFIPNFDRELLTKEERQEVLESIAHYMGYEDFGYCFRAFNNNIYPKLMEIINPFVQTVTEKNERTKVKTMKEEVKKFLKTYEVPVNVLPVINIDEDSYFPTTRIAP